MSGCTGLLRQTRTGLWGAEPVRWRPGGWPERLSRFHVAQVRFVCCTGFCTDFVVANLRILEPRLEATAPTLHLPCTDAKSLFFPDFPFGELDTNWQETAPDFARPPAELFELWCGKLPGI